MKILALLLSFVSWGFAAAPEDPTKAALPASQKQVVTVADFKARLIAAGKWSWNIGTHRGQTIEFREDGSAVHSETLMKYTVDAIGVVTVRHPNGKKAKLTFSKDVTSYEGAWDKTVPLSGKPIE